MKFTVERNWIDVLGRIWMPNVEAAMTYDLGKYEMESIGAPTRENVEEYLTKHAGDFQEIIDFHAVVGETEIAWESEENEIKYNMYMYPEEKEI